MKSDQLIRDVVVDSASYGFYQNKSCINATICWPTFSFIAYSNSAYNMNMDILRFIEVVASVNVSILLGTIAAMEFGFRFYAGSSTMQFGEVGLMIVDPNSTKTIVTPVEIKNTI